MHLHHCDQKAGALNHVQDMRYLINQDQRRESRRVRDQSEQLLKNAQGAYVENHSPKEQQLVFLRRGAEGMQSG